MSDTTVWWCCAAEYGEHEPTCPNYAADEIERKLTRQMARRRERAILEIRRDIEAEIARHEERIEAERERHREALADYERELRTYDAQTDAAAAATATKIVEVFS